MERVSVPRSVRFGIFEVDLRAGELRKGGLRIRLQEQPFQVLAKLLERPGEVVTREELQKKLWPNDTFVDFDHGVNTAINKIRQALGDSAENPRFVETVARRGYRFICVVEVVAPPPVAALAVEPASPQAPVASEPPSPAVTPASPLAAKAAVSGRRSATGTPPLQGGWWRAPAIAVAGLALLAALLVGLNVGGWRDRVVGRARAPRIESLAVLPLANLSGDAEQDYLADGMTEELTTDLSKIRGLRVISRTSAMRFKGANKSLPEIARELNVDGVIEGSVERSGNRVRITAQLIHAPSDTHLWADSYERDLGDILLLEDEVARDVANRIKIRLTPAEQVRLSSSGPVDPQAYQSYLEGRYYWNLRTEDGLNRGIEYFHDAIAKDPHFALAYAGLAESYITLEGYGVLPAKDAHPLAKAAALKALQLDEGLAEAHTALACVHADYELDPVAAEKEFKRAIELNPSYATAHQWYAEVLSGWGRHKEAIAEDQRALELDPLSMAINTWFGAVLYLAGENDKAIAQLRKAIEMDRNVPIAHLWLGRVYIEEKMFKEAIGELQSAVRLSGGRPVYLAALGRAYVASGKSSEADKILTQLMQLSARKYVPAYEVAALCAGLGRQDQAFQWLEKAREDRSSSLPGIESDSAFDSLRSAPRYTAFLRQLRPRPRTAP